MTRCSVQASDEMLIKGYEFLYFAKNMNRNIGKNIRKNVTRNLLSNLLQMQLKLLQKEQFKKQRKQLVIWLEIKLMIELQESQKLDQLIIEKQMKRNTYIKISISRTKAYNH